jgi:hypothetical protein
MHYPHSSFRIPECNYQRLHSSSAKLRDGTVIAKKLFKNVSFPHGRVGKQQERRDTRARRVGKQIR